MSRYLMVTWDGAGNQVSTLTIARRLAQRGHDVRMLGHPSVHERAGSHGWRFRPFTHTKNFDSTAAFDVDDEFAVLSRDLWFSADVAHDVQEELAQSPADVVVADCMLMGALSAGEAAGLPTAALFHAPFSGFRAGPMVEMLQPSIPALNALRVELGLAPVTSVAEVHDACAVSLVCAPREFEPEMPRPANVRFVGPLLDGPPLTRVVEDLAVTDGSHPLIIVAFSTSYQGQRDVVRRVVDALADEPVKVVVTTGPALSVEAIVAPPNTVVAGFVDHHQLLPRASLVVTHAGLGTAMTALSHGVPMLCLPMGRDQFFNAAMIERLGAGRTIDMNSDPEAVRAGVRELLGDSEAKANAKRLAGTITGYGGGDEAVQELERLVRSAEPRT